mgnify:CR=1 FL=1
MPTLIELITELGSLTLQMEKITGDNDWALAENIQKTRASMIARLIEIAETSGLSEDETQKLREIRQQETDIFSKAIDHRDSIGKILAQSRPEKRSQKTKMNLFEKAYGKPNRRQ